MKWPIFALIVLLVVVIYQSLFRVIDLGLFVPDILLLLVLGSVWSFNNYDFIFFAVLGGVWMEIFAGLPIGALSLGLIIIGSIAYLVLNRWLFSEKPWQYFLGAVMLGTLVTKLWLWAYLNVLSNMDFIGVNVGIALVWRSFIPTLLVNLILIYPIFASMELLAKYLQNFSRNKLQL